MPMLPLYSLVNTLMRRFRPGWTFLLLGLVVLPPMAGAVGLKVSRAALERTLKQQLFRGADGRDDLKGDARSAEDSLYGDSRGLSGAGCGRGYECEVRFQSMRSQWLSL